MAHLLATVKGLQSLLKFIDGGDVAATLGDIEMAAARDAFKAVPQANNKLAQIRECITHLSSAQHAYEQFICTRSVGVMTVVRVSRESDVNVKRRFVLVLKAICYKYVGEERLCREALELAKLEVEAVRQLGIAITESLTGMAWLLAGAVTGVIFVEIGYMAFRGIGQAKDAYGIDDEAFSNIEAMLASILLTYWDCKLDCVKRRIGAIDRP
jgi:hypothetical protein